MCQLGGTREEKGRIKRCQLDDTKGTWDGNTCVSVRWHGKVKCGKYGVS